MLSEFLTRFLVLLFGYAYPAFECFKAVEFYPHSNPQLKFWCQYWVIVAIVTVVERVADVFISWLPMYGEAKLAFFVYLWYPKRKGTDVVYDTFLRPFVMQYEPDIEQRFRWLRANSGELLIFYLKNFTDKGYFLFREALRFITESAEKRKKSSSSSWWSRKSPKSPEPGMQFYEQLMHDDAADRDGRPRRRGRR